MIGVPDRARRRLVCAATLPELATFSDEVEPLAFSSGNAGARGADGTLFLLTGVGIACTLDRLLPLVADWSPTRIVNIGIAGAYPASGLAIGDIVIASSEVYGDVGFELPDAPGFQPITESPFGEFYAAPLPLTPDPDFIADGRLVRRARGCTVNTCTGTERTARLRERLFDAQFETMEGAAVAQVSLRRKIPATQIRAISNIASTRDMRPENIERALANLRDYLRACRESGEAS